MGGKKWPFRYEIGNVGLVLVALCIVAIAGFARISRIRSTGAGKPPGKVVGGFENVRAVPPGGPAPRMADKHVDMSGLWYPNHAGRMLEGAYPVDRSVFRQFDPKENPEQPLVFKPGMAEKYKSPVPYGTCDQAGTPSSITMQENQHGPLWIMQNPGLMTILIEYPLTVRMIHTDGRPHMKDPDPTFNGDAAARWEGDTLVVDVIAIDDKLRNVAVGFPGESGAGFIAIRSTSSSVSPAPRRTTSPTKSPLRILSCWRSPGLRRLALGRRDLRATNGKNTSVRITRSPRSTRKYKTRRMASEGLVASVSASHLLGYRGALSGALSSELSGAHKEPLQNRNISQEYVAVGA